MKPTWKPTRYECEMGFVVKHQPENIWRAFVSIGDGRNRLVYAGEILAMAMRSAEEAMAAVEKAAKS